MTNKEYRTVSLRLWSLLILLLICLPAFAQYSGNVQGEMCIRDRSDAEQQHNSDPAQPQLW